MDLLGWKIFENPVMCAGGDHSLRSRGEVALLPVPPGTQFSARGVRNRQQ